MLTISDEDTDKNVQFLLSAQGFGHYEFHNGIRTLIMEFHKSRLKKAREPPGLNVVVGVEYGSEIDEYTKKGWHTLAVEPNPVFHAILERKCQATCKLNKCGAGEFDATGVPMAYQGDVFQACTVQLDQIIKTKVESLSIDIQGLELNVLKGSKRLLRERQIDVIFAEYQPGIICKNLLEFLSFNGYVLFDFLWYGQAVASRHPEYVRFDTNKSMSMDIENYCKLASFTSANYSAHYGLEHDSHRSARQYMWLQNDIVAVHRAVFDAEFADFLSNLRQLQCGRAFQCSTPAVHDIKF